jgi:type II secretory pathway component PulC
VPKWQKQIPPSPKSLALVLFGIMVALMVYQTSEFYHIRSVDSASAGDSRYFAEIKKTIPQSSVVAPTLEQLSIMHLMGDPNKPVIQSIDNSEKITDTKLNFILMGIITNTRREKSSALIQDSNKQTTKRYFVGDALDGGIVVQAVDLDSVVLRHGEKLETLRYPAVTTAIGNTSTPPVGFNPQSVPIQPPIFIPAQPPASATVKNPVDLKSRLDKSSPMNPGRHP